MHNETVGMSKSIQHTSTYNQKAVHSSYAFSILTCVPVVKTLIVVYFIHFPDIEIKMGKRKNQPLIDSESDSNNDSGSDLDSVSLIEFLIEKNCAFSDEMYHLS